MPYKTILLSLNETRRNPVLLDLAAKLAGAGRRSYHRALRHSRGTRLSVDRLRGHAAILEAQRDYFKVSEATVEFPVPRSDESARRARRSAGRRFVEPAHLRLGHRTRGGAPISSC